MGNEAHVGSREALDKVPRPLKCLRTVYTHLKFLPRVTTGHPPRPMIEAAWDWAKARNLWRVNPIHKEEEIKVVLEDAFKYAEESGFETRQEATMEMEDLYVIRTLCAHPS